MYSDDYSEKELQKLERRLQKIYKQANRELTEKARDYFIQFEDRYNEEYLKYQAGVIGKQEFENWVNTQVGRGKRWEKLRDQMAMRLSDTNWLASDYINGTTPRVYAENYNYSAYTIEQTGNNISFTLLDENTVMRLSEGEKDLLPKAKVNIPKDQQWNKKRLQNALLQGILQGDSVTHLADRLQTVTNMNRNSAIRNARTMVTGAQNGGRQRSYENASKMGLEVQKEWMSASDNRVRDSHAQLNGVRVKYTEKFPNGCRYPADPSGRAEEVYNCRCTMVAITPHANQRTRTNNTVASYNKWKQQKEEKRNVNYMSSSFRPKYGTFEKLVLNKIEMDVTKVTNSKFDMVADISDKRNKSVRLTEKMLTDIQEDLPENFEMPKIAVVDFARHGLNENAIGGYHAESGTMYINSRYDTKKKILDFVNKQEGQFANKTEYAAILHELGHKSYYDAIINFTKKQGISYNEAKKSIDTSITKIIDDKYNGDIQKVISLYAYDGYLKGELTEVVAECFSVSSINEDARNILAVLGEKL